MFLVRKCFTFSDCLSLDFISLQLIPICIHPNPGIHHSGCAAYYVGHAAAKINVNYIDPETGLVWHGCLHQCLFVRLRVLRLHH